jgi:DMSO/TMAO reductase YedYZ molybdopterin-dependent catalytic subunit
LASSIDHEQMFIRVIPPTSRRQLLRQSLLCGGMWISGFNHLRSADFVFREAAASRVNASLLGLVPFSDEGHPPMQKPIGSELDGRLFTDLSALTPTTPVTPTEHFFVRTGASKLIDTSKPWTIQVGGVHNSTKIPIESLVKKSRPMGVHLMECSGNARSAQFGMLSVAAWDGVRLQDVLDDAKPETSGRRILVLGFDRYQEESMTSEPGASWIFTSKQLSSSGAFLATKMNGKPLTLDHGAPVRLVVPGWYGCVNLKWVNQIDYVSDDAAATSQMQEYASRTMQFGTPSLAREYRPALIEPVAMPTRIEKWSIAKKVRYRVMGIQWGVQLPRPEIEIRFDPGEHFVPVDKSLSTTGPCRFWSHEWSPPRAGRFTIRLRLQNMNTITSRLNSGYYDRSVEITEI